MAKLREVGEIAQHPHLAKRGTLETVELPGHDRPLSVVGAGFETDRRDQPRVPELGHDSVAILRDLGLDDAAIEALKDQGVVA